MELAWTNFIRRSRTFRHLWVGAYRDSESGIRNVHPCQKPVALMLWCLSLLPQAKVIIDPYMGSGSTGVACAKLGRSFIGIERDSHYFAIAEQRIRQAAEQTNFDFAPTNEAPCGKIKSSVSSLF